MQNLLASLLEEFDEILNETEHSVDRQYTFPKANNMIKVAVGMRRTGKSYFLYQYIHALIKQGMPAERILYINFEDERLLPLTQKQMGQLIDAFYTIYPENHGQLCYLFLDEVQNIEGWPLVIRRLHDKKNVQIYITGSSSKLLSKEIASSLRGRAITLEIWPYSFAEYLNAHQLTLSPKPHGKRAQDITQKYLLDYFKTGGFPGVQQLNDVEHRHTLQNYVDTVIMRDIVERHHITNIALIKYLIHTLLKNFSSSFSINKFYNDIKSQGYKVGRDTLYNYMDYLEDAFLLFSVSAFTESLRKSQSVAKKIYSIDNGLVGANVFSVSDKLGSLLENQIYIDLRRQGGDVYYYRTKEGYEIDFVVRKRNGELALLQAVWDSSDPQTLAREQRALQAAEQELGVKGRIIDLESYIGHALRGETLI